MFATVMAIKVVLLVLVLATLFTIHQLAATVLGGWQGGWRAAVVGAGVGAALGLPLGVGVALLKIPQRLGLDKRSSA